MVLSDDEDDDLKINHLIQRIETGYLSKTLRFILMAELEKLLSAKEQKEKQ
jgi:hypothetical protein